VGPIWVSETWLNRFLKGKGGLERQGEKGLKEARWGVGTSPSRKSQKGIPERQKHFNTERGKMSNHPSVQDKEDKRR